MKLINLIRKKKELINLPCLTIVENGLRVILQSCRVCEVLAGHTSKTKQMRKLGNY